MGYADHVRSSVRPTCWGNSNSYDPHDTECANCRYQHSCNVEINRGGQRTRTTDTGYRRTEYRPKDSDMGESGTHKAGMVGEEESPAARFAKDAAAGGLRGMFYEMWQFWRHFRIR